VTPRQFGHVLSAAKILTEVIDLMHPLVQDHHDADAEAV
jgi:hypothetical protein